MALYLSFRQSQARVLSKWLNTVSNNNTTR